MISLEPRRHGKLTGIYNEPMGLQEALTILAFVAAYWIFAGTVVFLVMNV